mgnify:CR=1 FL=1
MGLKPESQHQFSIFEDEKPKHKVLMNVIDKLVEKGNTVVIIEHNLEIIKSADWVIDLGPEGGDKGGELIFEGIPEDLVKVEKSYTGKALKGKL